MVSTETSRWRLVTLLLLAVFLMSTLTGCLSLPGGKDDTPTLPPLFNPDGNDDPLSEQIQPDNTRPTQAEPVSVETEPVETEPQPTEPEETEPEETEPTTQPTEPETKPTEPEVPAEPIAYGILTGDYVNVRSGPGTNYGTVDNLRVNTRLEILAKNGNWCQTRKGWISMQYVYIDGTVGPQGSRMGTVDGEGVNIRSGPGTNYGVRTMVNTGDRLEILYQVTIKDMTWGCTSKGWICMAFVKLDS